MSERIRCTSCGGSTDKHRLPFLLAIRGVKSASEAPDNIDVIPNFSDSQSAALYDWIERIALKMTGIFLGTLTKVIRLLATPRAQKEASLLSLHACQRLPLHRRPCLIRDIPIRRGASERARWPFSGEGDLDITEIDITESAITNFQEIDITESDITKKRKLI